MKFLFSTLTEMDKLQVFLLQITFKYGPIGDFAQFLPMGKERLYGSV